MRKTNLKKLPFMLIGVSTVLRRLTWLNSCNAELLRTTSPPRVCNFGKETFDKYPLFEMVMLPSISAKELLDKVSNPRFSAPSLNKAPLRRYMPLRSIGVDASEEIKTSPVNSGHEVTKPRAPSRSEIVVVCRIHDDGRFEGWLNREVVVARVVNVLLEEVVSAAAEVDLVD